MMARTPKVPNEDPVSAAIAAPPPPPPKTRTPNNAMRSGLTAAGMKIDPSGSDKLRRVQRAESWQEEAWRFYHSCGEIKVGMAHKANALRRVRLVAARLDDNGRPQIIEDPNDPAWVEVRRLKGAGSSGEILANMVLQLDVVGDGYLNVWRDEKGRERCRVCSISEVQFAGGRTIIRTTRDKKDEGREVQADQEVFFRVWTPDPEFEMEATSPMQGILERLDELDILSRSVRGTAKSRIAGAGLLTWPEEADLTDTVVEEILEHMVAPIRDESSVSSTVPFILKMPKDLIDYVRHIKLERPLDTQAMAERTELLSRITRSLNQPPEVIEGFANVKYRNAQIVSQETWTAYYEPDVIAICNTFTEGFLRLIDPDERTIVWYDASGVVGIPDNSANAMLARDKNLIGDEATRRELGFSEADAPNNRDRLTQLLSTRGILTNNLTVKLLGHLGILDPATVEGLLEAPVDPLAVPEPGLTAAGRRLSAGERLARLDKNVLIRLRDLAEAEVKRHLEIAGAAAKRRLGRLVSTSLADVPLHTFCRNVGLSTLTANQFAIGDFGDFGDFFDIYDELVRGTQAEAAAIVGQSSGVDLEMLSAVQKRNRAIGWARLQKQLAQIVEVAGEVPVDDIGELVAGVRYVSPGIIRESLSLAGGAAPNQIGAGGGVLTSTFSGTQSDSYSGMLATGDDIMQAVNDAGGSVLTFRWEYGDGQRQRPFEPHLALDGIEVDDVGASEFANSETFPPYPTYFPGDHAGSLAPGTIVSGPAARGASLRYWRGQLVDLSFASGEFLSTTPNHPILTRRGWVAAGQLVEGDEVLRCVDADRIADLIPDKYQMPASVEDVVATVAVSPGVVAGTVKVSAENFHGDGLGSEIAVVWADSNLGDSGQASFVKPDGQLPLSAAYPIVGVGLPGESTSAESIETVRPAPFSVPSFDSDSHALLRGPSSIREPDSLTTSSDRDISIPENFGDRRATNAETLGESLDGLAGAVESDKLIGLRFREFAGHVYDLQTNVRWYLANGIIVHNCLCMLVPVLGE